MQQHLRVHLPQHQLCSPVTAPSAPAHTRPWGGRACSFFNNYRLIQHHSRSCYCAIDSWTEEGKDAGFPVDTSAVFFFSFSATRDPCICYRSCLHRVYSGGVSPHDNTCHARLGWATLQSNVVKSLPTPRPIIIINRFPAPCPPQHRLRQRVKAAPPFWRRTPERR